MIEPTILFYVRSGWWKRGWVLARNDHHAVSVAANTGLHRRGHRITVLEADERFYTPEIREMARAWGEGRVLWANRWLRPDTILLREPSNLRLK